MKDTSCCLFVFSGWHQHLPTWHKILLRPQPEASLCPLKSSPLSQSFRLLPTDHVVEDEDLVWGGLCHHDTCPTIGLNVTAHHQGCTQRQTPKPTTGGTQQPWNKRDGFFSFFFSPPSPLCFILGELPRLFSQPAELRAACTGLSPQPPLQQHTSPSAWLALSRRSTPNPTANWPAERAGPTRRQHLP